MDFIWEGSSQPEGGIFRRIFNEIGAPMGPLGHPLGPHGPPWAPMGPWRKQFSDFLNILWQFWVPGPLPLDS